MQVLFPHLCSVSHITTHAGLSGSMGKYSYFLLCVINAIKRLKAEVLRVLEGNMRPLRGHVVRHEASS